jgi:GIY-YIG catalytic domain
MMRFNSLLQSAGIDPATVKLVRHQNTESRTRTPHTLWLNDKAGFDLYNASQVRPIYDRAKVIAAFVATPLNETLFVGLYDLRGRKRIAENSITCPLSGNTGACECYYDLTRNAALASLAGRLVIEWGPGYRSWVQRAANKDKPILELRRERNAEPFPGFMEFRRKLSELPQMPVSWRETLSHVSGIYLLTCPTSGKQYVGSACGEGGLWQRWENYVATGHGGNKRLLEIPRSDYQVSILEVVSSSADESSILHTESRWKEKLQSKSFGLNAN